MGGTDCRNIRCRKTWITILGCGKTSPIMSASWSTTERISLHRFARPGSVPGGSTSGSGSFSILESARFSRKDEHVSTP